MDIAATHNIEQNKTEETEQTKLYKHNFSLHQILHTSICQWPAIYD
jgi:hypothetical protein